MNIQQARQQEEFIVTMYLKKVLKPLESVKSGFLIAMIFILLFACAENAFANRQTPTDEAATEQAEGEEGAASLSAWDILEMTSWLFWPFVFVTGGGLFLISYRGLIEYQENSRSQALLQQKIGVRDLRNVIRAVQSVKPNRASRLIQQMVSTFNKTNRAEPISSDVNQFVTAEKEAFETFNRVLGFLSDSAGALGLLGTVWGIFETFHGGKLDGPTILMGMSVSLVTTLVGLLISLALNFGGTTIFAIFNRHMGALVDRAEELRQALLYLETRPNKATAMASNADEYDVKSESSRMQRQRSVRPPVAEADPAYQPKKSAPRESMEKLEKKVPLARSEQRVREISEEEVRARRNELPDVFASKEEGYQDDENVW